MTATGKVDPAPPPRWLKVLHSLRDRRMGAMLILAFAASLPLGAVLGVLTAWLTEEGVDTGEIGALSLVTMGYAFKYLWAPVFQTSRSLPWLARLGGRRSWLVTLQVLIGGLLCLLAFTDPAENLALVAGVALMVTLLSPTHDLILDAWRIEVARSEEDKDLMSALYQFGYKFGGFVSGFLALMLAARAGWVVVYLMLGGFMVLTVIGSLLAPDPKKNLAREGLRMSFFESLPQPLLKPAIAIVGVSWLLALGLIGQFVIQALVLETGASGRTFVRNQGPWIVFLTVIVPAVMAAGLIWRHGAVAQETARISMGGGLTGTLFRSIYDPLMELISRLKWGAVLVLALALTYRFTDAVWGSFAYPFYLGENHGALGHSLDDVAIASKFVGVIATILGSLIGAIAISAIGRMPVFVLGGIVAAVTNLLYADLAAGAVHLDGFLDITGLGVPLMAFAEWAAAIQPDDVVLAEDQGRRMARLMLTILAENIAGGLALVALTAYLTSVVNPRFAAVQYALLASLTMLIGTLGRPWLGEMIETEGFYTVFMVTFWLGGVAVGLSLVEWVRQARERAAKAEAAVQASDT